MRLNVLRPVYAVGHCDIIVYSLLSTRDTVHYNILLTSCRFPLTSTWPHQNSDVGLEEGEY